MTLHDPQLANRPNTTSEPSSASTPGRKTRTVRRPALALGVAALASVAACTPSATVPAALTPGGFAAAPAFSKAIPAAPWLDANSAAMVRRLSDPTKNRILNVGLFGQAVYEASSTTPRVNVQVTNAPGWGDNDLAHVTVPIPAGATPSTGSDSKLVVIDRSAGQVYDMWDTHQTASGWTAGWGGVYPLNGDGTSHNVTYGSGANQVAWPKPVSRSTGSGISSLAGLAKIDEIAAGRVDHALVISSTFACGPANSGPFRYPATTTDGYDSQAGCIPEGSRIQLDPSVNLAAIPGILPFELTLGRALQTHGAYVIDNGGAAIGIVGENPRTAADHETWMKAGVYGDYNGMNHLPWLSLRVLRNSNGN